jgi:hypothetical protein
MKCNCIKTVDEKLAEQNLRLAISFKMPNFTPAFPISTAYIDKEKAPRGKKNNPPSILASFCPFCGTKLED